ncbi:unnamed protein product [Aureobasidium mustum]|uniref:PPM-type phosphatase domain-containing protein n=1 Tax=Aureobasidium mustum TaxID=2773714 RepID=A0A9N8K363_9PEZI|nr:unnamed protein product [Aureobasidium mustum]
MRSWRLARINLRRGSRTPIRHYHAKPGPNLSQTRRANGAKYTAATASAALAGSGIWWLTTPPRDDVPDIQIQQINRSGLSKDDITRILSREAYSFPVKGVPGVARYDGAQLASNSPCEDRFVHGKMPSPRDDDKPWMAWAIFDGHAGSQTAELLSQQLVPMVQQYLRPVNLPSKDQPESKQSAQHAITKAFVDLDTSIIDTAKEISQGPLPLQEKMRKLMPAFAGSCALLALYDPVTKNLHVACTGDSRAVLGRKTSDGTWEAIPLSIDQTGSNTDEIARLYSEHPNEEDIVKNGRVLGLMVSRAFGDGRWKWGQDLQKEFVEKFHAPALRPSFKVQTPPYVTAGPVVTSTAIDANTPSFLILASDGMWDNLTNQQAVDLVARWLENPSATPADPRPKPLSDALDFGHLSRGVVNPRFEEERTTTQDSNAAVHLVRNSLGGNRDELLAGRLAASAPFSRDIRDDITVQVAFFNCSR